LKATHDRASTPVLPDVSNLEPEVGTEASAEPLPTSIEHLSTSIGHEPETVHSEEPVEGPSENVFDGNTPGIELQSELEHEPVLSTTSQETGVDVVSTSKDTSTPVVVHEAETEVETETHETDTLISATAAIVLLAAESTETEQPTAEVLISYSCANPFADLVSPGKDDFSKDVNEAFIEAAPSATAEDVLSIDKVVPEVTHEAVPEAGNNSVMETALKVEPQREYEVDVTVPDTEDTIPDMHSSPPNDPISVSLPLEPEITLPETEVAAENQVEAAATTDAAPIDVEVQPILNETASNSQKDIGTQTQVDDISDFKDEPIPETEVADIEGPLADVPPSSTKESRSTTQLEPEVDFVAPAEEEASAITQVEAENILPRIESEGVTSQSPDETISAAEDATASVANVEEQIIVPVDVQSEHSALVETSSTDKLAEVIHLPVVEERPETLAPPVEPSHKSSYEMLGVSVLFIPAHTRSLNYHFEEPTDGIPHYRMLNQCHRNRNWSGECCHRSL
jgi:hypothetical protein